MKIKLVILGDSNFNNYDLFKHKLDEYLSLIIGNDTAISVSVLCTGHYKHLMDTYITDKQFKTITVDYLSMPLLEYIAATVIKACDCSIIFSEGVDSGIKMWISMCEHYETKFRVVNYRNVKKERTYIS